MHHPRRFARILMATTVLGSSLIGVSSISEADPNSASITVKYKDLNPATPSGAQVLYQRIHAAAKSACNFFWFKSDAEEAGCVQRTITNAVTKVNQPALTAVYDAKNPILAPGPLVSRRQ